MQILEYIISAL